MRRGWRCALLLAAAALSCTAHAADAEVEQPRAFGYVLGDMLTQRVLLSADGRDVRDIALPSAGRVGTWLDRREPRIEKDGQGRAWMVIDYQVVNAAPTLTQAEIPAFELGAGTATTLRVAAWPISIGALTPRASFGAGDLQPLRPDRLAAPRDQSELRKRMVTMLSLALLTLAGWLAWWTWRRHADAERLPFARAWQAIRKLDAAELDRGDAAWVHLHRAFDDTAGQVVHAPSLRALFVRAPYLEAFAPRLEAFFARSQQRFFGGERNDAPFPLREFARTLYRAERRR
jgi:mxaA protein